MERLRNLVIALAGNIVFCSGAKSNKDKFIHMYDSYMVWLWDRKNSAFHNKMPAEFPTILWPDGYQRILIEFSQDPSPEQLTISGGLSREMYLGEKLWKKFCSIQSDMRNKYNPFWKPVSRSGWSREDLDRLHHEAVLQWHWNVRKEDNHKQRYRDLQSRTAYKLLIDAEEKAEWLQTEQAFSDAIRKEFPVIGKYFPNDFYFFKLLGMAAGEDCLK
jgi:hypothetical protein